MNFLEARIVSSDSTGTVVATPEGFTVSLASERFSAQTDQSVNIGVRANHLEVVDSESGDFVMEVGATEQLGGETYLYGSVGQNNSFTVHLPGQVNIERGEKIGVVLRKSETQLFDLDGGESLRRY